MTARTHLRPAVMVQGTGSNVGKSIMVAGLARVFARRGLRVFPFKPQNMSNNAAVTADGGEIGRAQALQAYGAGVAPSVHMNPVLLKPETDQGSQVIVQGRRFGTLEARDFGRQKGSLLSYVEESFCHLEQEADLILVEGAGSPAEINLRSGDIANMGFAQALDVPVILAGDIDRGGVIAALVGTAAVLESFERDRVKGFFINKFRGDPSLFDSGLTEIEKRTGWPGLGVVPWFEKAGDLPEEDALGLDDRQGTGKVTIAVPVVSRIANFDDLDPLRMEEQVTLRMIYPGQALPGDADLVLLPGTKSTIGDLAFLRAQGWDIDIAAHVRRGGRVLGICGGYQMLGRTIRDPQGIEGSPGSCEGLGLLDVETLLTPDKQVVAQTGTHLSSNEAVSGYEIHIGQTHGHDCDRPFLKIGGRPDGAQTTDGQIAGTYLHGLFGSDGFRAAYLESLGATSTLAYSERVEAAMDGLADHLERHLDCDRILAIARSRGG